MIGQSYGDYGTVESDGEENKGYIYSASKEVRNGFITKVYSILCVQLVVTAMVASPFVANDGVRDFARKNRTFVLFGSLIFNMCLMIFMSCNPKLLREYPTNYGLLFALTIGEGVFVGAVCSLYTMNSVLWAVLLTAVLVLALTIYADMTETDFTEGGPYLFAALVTMCIFGFFLMFVQSPFLHKVYCCFGILLFSFFLIYDTQQIMGNGSLKLGVDDYVFGALQLYLDIIELFLFILQLTGDRD